MVNHQEPGLGFLHKVGYIRAAVLKAQNELLGLGVVLSICPMNRMRKFCFTF